MKKIISSMAMLPDEALDLIAKHMEQNPNISFENPFEAWYDEDNNLCVRYSDTEWYHYNIERGEWW
jgi:hypothetical protein